MVRALASSALVFLAMSTALSGCSQCAPMLDVRNCQAECDRPASDPVRPWDPAYDMWPDLEALINRTDRGEHEHVRWTENQADAFWAFMQVPADRQDKQVFIQKGDDVFRVRVLSC